LYRIAVPPLEGLLSIPDMLLAKAAALKLNSYKRRPEYRGSARMGVDMAGRRARWSCRQNVFDDATITERNRAEKTLEVQAAAATRIAWSAVSAINRNPASSIIAARPV